MNWVIIVIIAALVGTLCGLFARRELKVWFDTHEIIRDKDGHVTHIIGKGKWE